MKTLKILVGIFSVPVIIILGWYMVTYTSLKNPIDEMIYSEITRFKVVSLPSYSQVIHSDTAYDLRDDGGFVSLHYNLNNIEKNEYVSIYVDNIKSFLFIYDLSLENGESLVIIYDYDDSLKKMKQIIYLEDKNGVRIDSADIVLQKLSQKGLDKKWLQEKSDFLLNEVILKPWFEKGSQRYSFEHLGNLKIEESALLK